MPKSDLPPWQDIETAQIYHHLVYILILDGFLSHTTIDWRELGYLNTLSMHIPQMCP